MGLVVHQGTRPAPIYYITATHGLAPPAHVPDAVVEGFAARVVGLLGNLSPASGERGYEVSRRYLSPGLGDAIQAQARDDLKRIVEQQLATTFAIYDTAVEVRGQAWHVILRGTRQSWSRSQFLGEDSMRYTVEVRRTPPTELNPWGLEVNALRLDRDPGAASQRSGKGA
jgi:hypothetical protein